MQSFYRSFRLLDTFHDVAVGPFHLLVNKHSGSFLSGLGVAMAVITCPTTLRLSLSKNSGFADNQKVSAPSLARQLLRPSVSIDSVYPCKHSEIPS
jgi:hypothetical protein